MKGRDDRLSSEPVHCAPLAAPWASPIHVEAIRSVPVLLVEDEPLIAVTLEDDLAEHGFAVRHSGNGAHAVQWLQDEAFAAVITDLRLPGADGFAVLQAARRRCRPLPVLVITASGAAVSHELHRRGADAVLLKPFPNERVIAWLRMQLAGGRAMGGA